MKVGEGIGVTVGGSGVGVAVLGKGVIVGSIGIGEGVLVGTPAQPVKNMKTSDSLIIDPNNFSLLIFASLPGILSHVDHVFIQNILD